MVLIDGCLFCCYGNTSPLHNHTSLVAIAIWIALVEQVRLVEALEVLHFASALLVEAQVEQQQQSA